MGKASKRLKNIQRKKDQWIDIEIDPNRSYVYHRWNIHGSHLIEMGIKTVRTRKSKNDNIFPIFGL